MEEEHFFYYLTHGSNSNAKNWNDDTYQGRLESNNREPSLISSPSSQLQEECSQDNHLQDKDSQDDLSKDSQGLISFDSQTSRSITSEIVPRYPSLLDTTIVMDRQSERYINSQSLTASERRFLLPPMNGKVDYSRLGNIYRADTPLHGLKQRSEEIIESGSLHRPTPGSPLGSTYGPTFGSTLQSTLESTKLGPALGPTIGPTLERGDSFFKPLIKRSSSAIGPALERSESFFEPLIKRSSSFFVPLSRRATSFVEPFSDHMGSPKSVVLGLFNLTVLGTLIGLIMPHNEQLPTPWYRVLSSIIGYSYFIFWCASFYPQVVMNYQRKSTEGLSIDYTVVNFFGCLCYMCYTNMFYYSKAVREMYIERYINANPDGKPPEITVESNDVAYGMNALVLSIIWLIQIELYGGFKKCRDEGRPIISKSMSVLIYLILGSCSAYAALIGYYHVFHDHNSVGFVSRWLNWLDYLYYIAYMKVVITAAKNIPQIILNMRRKSCVGWSVWNIWLDFAGGVFSFAQLVGDAIDLNDLQSIAGNSAKLVLSAVSIFFDIIFLLQHYVWYAESHNQSPQSKVSIASKKKLLNDETV